MKFSWIQTPLNLLAWLITATLPIHVFAATEIPTVVFELNSSGINCSAALMRLNGECHLITAKHCVPLANQAMLSTAQVPTNFDAAIFPILTETKTSPLPVTVQKRSERYDLAELSIPPQIKSQFCDSRVLKNSQSQDRMIDPKSQMAVNAIALGIIAGQPQVRITGDSIDESRHPQIIRLSPHYYDRALFLPDLDIRPGMSGGPTINSRDQSLMGINTHYIPFQNTGGVTPLPTIANFLASMSQGRTSDAVRPNNQLQLSGGNEHAHPGGNEHATPGGNEHATPGGNEHATPGAHDVSHPVPDDDIRSIENLREPDEGVPHPTDPSRIILAIKTSGIALQVDGYDDMNMLSPIITALPNDVITRSAEGYPSLEIRKGILNRLAGSYGELSPEEKYQRVLIHRDPTLLTADQRTLIFEDTPERRGSWASAKVGTPRNSVIVNPMTSSIEFSIERHQLFPAGSRSPDLAENFPPQPAKIKFQFAFTDQLATTAVLTGRLGAQEHRLTCDNRHYFKLICSDQNWILSLSLNGETGRVNQRLSYRLSHLQTLNEKRKLINIFGKLKGEESRR